MPAEVALARGIRLRHDAARGRWLLLGPERGYVLNEPARVTLQRLFAGEPLAAIEPDGERRVAVARFVQTLVERRLIRLVAP